jgi:hypothetical protein
MEMIITLTDEQAQALEDYAALGRNLEWYKDERVGQNMPRRKYANGDAVLLHGLSTFLAGILAECPPQSVVAARLQMETLQQQVDVAGTPSVRKRA